ncbi:uncharacterized protein LOC135687093 [Rhopilema esculentum]|uniref:uncharacterized protein LOC135687093 n=1 Tax=Rhopilema esculentum TaxID=499914 RepID=UPI0031D07308|eukprot:gene6043-11418_t
MPGANCSIVGCLTLADNRKYPNLSFFRVPTSKSSAKSDSIKDWRAKLLHIISRADKTFNAERAFICSRHFTEECIRTGKKGRRNLKVGSLPTEFLPEKSVPTVKPNPRRQLTRNNLTEVPELYRYRFLCELQKSLSKIKDPWKVLLCEEEKVILGYISKDGDVIIKVAIDEALEFTVEYLFLELPVNHPIYKEHKRSIAKIPIQWLLESLSALNKCNGINDLKLKEYGEQNILDRRHTCNYSSHKSKDDGKISTVLRSNTCVALISDGDVCEVCKNVTKQLKRKLLLADHNQDKPISAKTPLKKVTSDRLSQTIINMRLNQKKLEIKIKELNQQIKTHGIQLDADLHNDCQNLIQNIKQELPEDSFEKLFWEQQQKAFQSDPTGTRWHPMMIRFALHIHLRSPSAYKALKESGVIKLPSEMTLRDYSNVFHPSPGFKKETFEDLKHQASKLKGIGKSGFWHLMRYQSRMILSLISTLVN